MLHVNITEDLEDSDIIQSVWEEISLRKREVVYADHYSEWRPCTHPLGSCPGFTWLHQHKTFTPVWQLIIFFENLATEKRKKPYDDTVNVHINRICVYIKDRTLKGRKISCYWHKV